MQLLNLIIFKEFRNMGMRQVGRRPHFCVEPDEKARKQMQDIEVWQGFKFSATIYNPGMFAILDTVNKFFRKVSCMDKIRSMKKDGLSDSQISDYFKGKRVLANWGKRRRIYVLDDVSFDETAAKIKFTNNDDKQQTMLKYF